MSSLFRSYGPVMGGMFVGMVALWIVALIVLPQLNMIERAFIYEPRGGAAIQAQVDVDRVTQRLFTIRYDIQELEKQAAEGGEGTGVFTPGAKIGEDNTGAADTVVTTPSLSGGGDSIAEQIARLEAEAVELEAQLVEMEAEEQRLKAEQEAAAGYSVRNFTTMNAIHFKIFVMTLFYSFCVTLICFVVCYPIAYTVAQTTNRERAALLMLGLIIPYAINELLRIFAWTMILANQGILNAGLDAIGILDFSQGETIRWVASNGAVFCVMVYAYILFMVFPIYNTIETLDRNQIEAARDLGASTWRIHRRVVLPHAKPGIAVGSIMTFMLSAGSIAVPGLVGPGLHPDWFSQVIYRNFFEAGNWNIGSAYSLALLVACLVFILIVMSVFKVGIRQIAR
ncbi:MAG: ABC transporter permease [Pseudomonadota bacterium]